MAAFVRLLALLFVRPKHLPKTQPVRARGAELVATEVEVRCGNCGTVYSFNGTGDGPLET